VKAKGKIDVLVVNAGIGEFAPLASLTEEARCAKSHRAAGGDE
jgi:NAD(P)-dependent dehydrogenase (short-subunit alcohol dehydrogenase family)